MKNILIIIKKEIKDTLKNKAVFLQFVIMPVLTLIMENAINVEGMPELYFMKMFSIMFIGMAPLAACAAIISEEKEKNTLRVLMMSNVKPWQYLIGIGVYVWIICMCGAAVMSIGLKGKDVLIYLSVMGVGFAISILIGSCVGIYAKNQMVATSLYMPVFMVLAFLPMLALFNETIKKVSKIFYTQQIRMILDDMSFDGITYQSAIIVSVNTALAIALFFLIFKKKGLE
ncbi:MAG: ABC transporter permease subunit [Lachnospiraceae bacterium]|nr:ABC transporter permease subunit [Lachnospiraceae bacterium]